MMLDHIKKNSIVRQLIEDLKTAKTGLSLTREGWGGLGPLLAALKQDLKRPVIYIGRAEEKVHSIFGDTSLFCSEARFFPKKEPPPLEDFVASEERFMVLQSLLAKETPFLFTTVSAILSPTRAPQTLEKQKVTLISGKRFSFQQLLAILEAWNYHHVDMVMGKNEFAVRGGIVDFFPASSSLPYRLEWNENEIDSIRFFDPPSQRSIQKFNSINIFPPESEQEAEAFLTDYLPSSMVVVLEEFDQWDIPDWFLKWSRQQQRLHLVSIPDKNAIPWPFKAVSHFEHRFRDFLNFAKSLSKDEQIYIYTRQASRLQEVLGENLLTQIQVLPSPLSEGFRIESERLSIYTDYELFGHVFPAIRRAHKSSRPILFDELKEGDIVVHAHHGIAQYEGLRPISVEGKIQDFLALSFAGNDKLYVPLEDMHLVERYIGLKGESHSLSKLSGERWRNTRKRVQREAAEIAQDLVKLYAARSQTQGHAFSPDTPWQAELEEAFPFEETPDQDKAIQSTKADMELPKPMDRLVLGDVGYGKTEVALRAAFKAIMDGKQVAILAPTTILAQQHGEMFKERLTTFPIHLELLSRFRTRKEIQQILRGLKTGQIDLVIGTHRLLQKDVQFKKLGLLIIDEEQRFGVKHKEMLKQLQSNVDVLTLSATPLPRTLYLSLVGVRDISVIETPPAERLPVKTFVVPKTEPLIQQAIRQEIDRGGQVYYLVNHIEKIRERAKTLHQLIPGARLMIAHGQMKSSDLEEAMWKFMKGFYDVLLCTTIIENGLDIPRVNTLMVEDAHRYGLAELYQIRGRVGRADRQAYAYLFLPSGKEISETAEKRLDTIQELSRLGSGYQIAMKDLEIRGAGNLLGVAQSGHVADVGFQLYCKLLEEEIRKLKGQKISFPLPRVELVLPVAAFLPDTYVPTRSQKLDFYRRLAALTREEELDEIVEELIDRFGDPPPEALNLIEMVKLRLNCLERQIHEIKMQKDEIKVSYWNGQKPLIFDLESHNSSQEIFRALREKAAL